MDKFDPRVDSLVMETRTIWDKSVGNLSDEDRRWLLVRFISNPSWPRKSPMSGLIQDLRE